MTLNYRAPRDDAKSARPGAAVIAVISAVLCVAVGMLSILVDWFLYKHGYGTSGFPLGIFFLASCVIRLLFESMFMIVALATRLEVRNGTTRKLVIACVIAGPLLMIASMVMIFLLPAPR